MVYDAMWFRRESFLLSIRVGVEWKCLGLPCEISFYLNVELDLAEILDDIINDKNIYW